MLIVIIVIVVFLGLGYYLFTDTPEQTKGGVVSSDHVTTEKRSLSDELVLTKEYVLLQERTLTNKSDASDLLVLSNESISALKKDTIKTIVTVNLAKGGSIKGELLREDKEKYVVQWQGGILGLDKDEVSYIEKQKERLQPKTVTIYLLNGSAVSGKLIGQTNDRYIIGYQSGTTEFTADEVDYIEEGALVTGEFGIYVPDIEEEEEWPYENDVVMRLASGEVLDGRISLVGEKAVMVRHVFKEGGHIEQEIKRSDIESLLFKPVNNVKSSETKKALKKLFPAMTLYTEGNITIITDSYITWVKKYKQALRRTQTEIYFNFYELYKTQKQSVQNFVVIFDNPSEYVKYAIADGVPGWIAPGYFSPTTNVLYLYNMIGEQTEEFIRRLMINIYGNVIDSVVDQVEALVHDRYHVFVEGQAKGIKDKYWQYFDWWMGLLRRTTFLVLRHEFTHEMLSNWGLVMVVVSTFDEEEFPHADKKKKFLETSDAAEGLKILMELGTLRSQDSLPPMRATNSWLAEGLATYGETEMLGTDNEERIFWFQEMLRENAFFPLEQLTVYKIGSFPGVCYDAMLYAYAESWALVTFFMEKYPDEFMQYVHKVGSQTSEANQDLEWLIEAIGKDARTIEKELLAFMDQFPEVENPLMKTFDKRKELHDSLVTFGYVKA